MAKILVVDDDPSALKPLARLLEMEGYEVLCAGNAITAMAQALGAAPDLILLDVAMPPMDGLTFLFLLREKPCGKYVPVIVVSGQEDEHTINRARALGVEEFLVKSHFKTSELLELVKRHLAQPRGRDAVHPLQIGPSDVGGDAKAGVGG